MQTASFDDPAYRAQLSPERYEAERLAHLEANTIEVRAGHRLRYVNTRFGRLVHVGETDSAFSALEDAQQFADANPAALD